MCKKSLYLVPVALIMALLLGNTASADLIAHWPLDGDFADATGNGHDGTPLDDPQFVLDGVKGLVMEVDGAARVMVEDAPDLNFTANESVTMTVWALYDPGLASSGWRSPCGKGRTAPGGDTSYLDTMYGFFVSPDNEWASNMGSLGGGVGPAVADEWHHFAFVQDGGSNENFYYINLEVVQSGGAADCSTPGRPFFIGASGSDTSPFEGFGGRISDVRIYNEALSGNALAATTIPLSSPGQAFDPMPNDKAEDVPLDEILSWTSGEFANTHDVYFGMNFDDVNDATKADPEYKTTKSLGDESYAPENLKFGTDYFWRIDEANAPPQQATVFKGEVWQFTTEPVAYPITKVTATASSSAAGQDAENTVNGSGLDADEKHSITATDMWLSDFFGPQPTWIQFEFDKAYALHELWVWNSNQLIEISVGVGIMDVTIEYSQDGEVWTKLDDVRFNQATGDSSYTANTTVDMKGVEAQFVRLTPKNNWMGILEQYGLSEVRFFYVPVLAREPDPQDGAIDIHSDVILSWRSGRQAAMHDVYLSTDEQSVMDSTAAATTVTEASYDAGTLELGETYHWRIDESNEAEIPAIWEGDIWSFTTADHIVVDNFESYNGLDPSDPQSNRVFMVWKDGAGYGTPESPPYSAGNGTGSLIGHAAPPFVEKQIVHDGSQSMPYFYDNRGLSGKANYSEVEVDISELAIGPDWTRAGVKTLTLQFYGDPANSAGEQMYMKINGVEVPYDGDSSNITYGIWQQWDIDLSSLVGVDLQNVTDLIIGFKNGSGTGVVYFDNIRLNPATKIPETQAPDDSALVAHWDFEGDFTDATGKGHDGLAYGDPTIVNDPSRGQVLEVDGDDRIGISDAVDLNYGANESMTLTTWVNFDLVDAPEGWKGIIAKGRTESGGGTGYVPELYGFYVTPSNNWHVNSGGIGGDAHEATSGQWHHLAFVQDGPAGEGYFYIDGEVVMSGGADSCDTTGRPLFIGAAGTDVAESAFEAFKGRIDDVRIYSYALSEPEIQYLVAGLQAPDDTTLVAHWDFEGDFSDATGKGHDGLAFGDPVIIFDPLRGQVLEVDGDDRIGVSDAADLNFGADESMTLTTWANLDLVNPLDGWRCIVAKGRTELGGGANYVDTFYGFYISPDNNWHASAGDVWDDSQPAAGGQWHHLAFVQDGPAGEGYFYIDGEIVATAGADSCDTTGRPLFIGAAGTDVDVAVFEAFKGRIDDVRIYSYALSELEIQYLVLEK